jgi:hypothetical protein
VDFNKSSLKFIFLFASFVFDIFLQDSLYLYQSAPDNSFAAPLVEYLGVNCTVGWSCRLRGL